MKFLIRIKDQYADNFMKYYNILALETAVKLGQLDTCVTVFSSLPVGVSGKYLTEHPPVLPAVTLLKAFYCICKLVQYLSASGQKHFSQSCDCQVQ